jgi:hypothetical protein
MLQIRPRISLLTTFLLLTIVGMAIVLTQLWREVAPLRAELRQLRKETGRLTIEDASKIHAIQVPIAEPDRWRYRVYLPKDRRFQLHSRIHALPGHPSQMTRKQWLARLLKARSGSSTGLESGEFTIDVTLQQDKSDPDQWVLAHIINGRGSGSVGSQMPWLNDRRVWSVSSDITLDQQMQKAPSDGVVLFELRPATLKEIDGGYTSTPPNRSTETPGLMLWIASESRPK